MIICCFLLLCLHLFLIYGGGGNISRRHLEEKIKKMCNKEQEKGGKFERKRQIKER
jgi:hypothetical protein